jgi:hypothetical protein
MKMTPENQIKQDIKLALKNYPNLRLFSNPRGTMKSGDRFVSYGLAPGSKDLASSDFIGWKTITITPEMVGHKIAQFVSFEIKASNKQATSAQGNWLELVDKCGGLAIVTHSVLGLERLDKSKKYN